MQTDIRTSEACALQCEMQLEVRRERTWRGRGCNRQGPWSWCHSQPSQHKPFPGSGKICRRLKKIKIKKKLAPEMRQCQMSSHVKVTDLMRSLLPSSLPRCSRPLVQAKMLAMGLVLVGLPCVQTQGLGQGCREDILLSVFTTGWQQNTSFRSPFAMTSLGSCSLAASLAASSVFRP